MTAGEYCTRSVVVTDVKTSVNEAAKTMRQYHVGDLVVTTKRDGQPVPIGIVTDRDLVMEVLAQDIAPESITVGDIMSPDPLMVDTDTTLLDTLERMQNRGVRRAVVVDNNSTLQGILSADDAIEIIAEASAHLAALFHHEIDREQQTRP